MKKLLLITLIGIISNFAFGQKDMTQYIAFVKKADSLYDAKDYGNSAIAYQKAFDSNDG